MIYFILEEMIKFKNKQMVLILNCTLVECYLFFLCILLLYLLMLDQFMWGLQALKLLTKQQFESLSVLTFSISF